MGVTEGEARKAEPRMSWKRIRMTRWLSSTLASRETFEKIRRVWLPPGEGETN